MMPPFFLIQPVTYCYPAFGAGVALIR